MKKLFYLINFVCSILLLASCSQSKEETIIAAFRDYVQKSFDDPSKMKEVVSIDSCDTISTKELKKIVSDMQKMSDSLFNAKRDIADKVSKALEQQTKYIEYANDELFKAAYDQYYNSIEEIANTFSADIYATQYNVGETIKKKYNRIQEAKDTSLIQYQIKCRIEENAELKLKTYYAISDLKEKEFRISNHPLQIAELGLSKFVEDCAFLTNTYSKRIQYRKEYNEALEVLYKYLGKDE